MSGESRAIIDILFKYIDRMNDPCEDDPAEKILAEFVEEVDGPMQDYIRQCLN